MIYEKVYYLIAYTCTFIFDSHMAFSFFTDVLTNQLDKYNL